MTDAARHSIGPLAAFAVLAYAVSWLIWLPHVAEARGWIDAQAWPYLHQLGGLGPWRPRAW